jgi:hypothetical protein
VTAADALKAIGIVGGITGPLGLVISYMAYRS